jgi:hypothetical protein
MKLLPGKVNDLLARQVVEGAGFDGMDDPRRLAVGGDVIEPPPTAEGVSHAED